METLEHEFRAYDPDADEFSSDGYPLAWRYLKHVVREDGEHRCARCKHPYRSGDHGNGEWSQCDEGCVHLGPVRMREAYRGDGSWTEYETIPFLDLFDYDQDQRRVQRWECEARWRILTVHHLDGDKGNLRWWNLVPLCQRCHLTIQGKVRMDRPYDRPHTDWFKRYAAGFYAFKYLGEDLSQTEVTARLGELLALELRQERLFTF